MRLFWPALLLIAVALVGMRVAGHRPPAFEPTDRPLEIARDGYVNSKTCRACHPSQYDSWHGSYHRRMTQVATPETVAADFDGTRIRIGPVDYTLERRGDELQVQVDPGFDHLAEQRRIVLLTGSHHRQWFWFPTGDGRRLGAMPFIYLIEDDRFIPREAGFMLAPDLDWTHSHHDGKWGGSCVSCHTTHGKMTTTFNANPETIEFGIACEACHGAAEEHLQVNRRPQERYGRYLGDGHDPSIVNPAELDHRRSSEVCGQCHTVSLLAAATAADEQRFETRHDYRPGEDLTALAGEYDSPEMIREATRWPDGAVRSGGREYDAMIATPCFQRGEMSCLSCHRMHREQDDPRSMVEWADDQLGPSMVSDDACLQCHDAALAKTEHTIHPPSSTGSRCYNCHMPFTSYALLKAIRNHGVSGPSVDESLESGRPNACNLCHLDKSLGWTASELEKHYEMPSPELTPDQQTIAASVQWLLSGYAGQRGLVAWHMGWQPAQEASGSAWLPAYLAQLLSDPYPAVRIMAARSLRTLPGFETFTYDVVGDAAVLDDATVRAVKMWQEQVRARVAAGDPELVDPSFALESDVFKGLLDSRDQRRISWLE